MTPQVNPWERDYPAAPPPTESGDKSKDLGPELKYLGPEPKIVPGSSVAHTGTQAQPTAPPQASAGANPWEKDYAPTKPSNPYAELQRNVDIFSGSSGASLAGDILGGGTRAVMDWLTGNADTTGAGERFKRGTVGLLGFFRDEPWRVADQIHQSMQAASRGDINGMADHLWFAVPFMGAGGQVMAEYLNKGDYLGALSHAGGMLSPFALEPAAGLAWKAPEAISEAAGQTTAAIGGGFRGARAALPKLPGAGAGGFFIGAPFGQPVLGAKLNMARVLRREVAKGIRQAIAERTAAAEAGAAAPAAAPPPAEAPTPTAPTAEPVQPVTGMTDDAVLQMYSLETDPVKRAALRQQIESRGLVSKPPPAEPSPNPYSAYSQDALRRVYQTETSPVKLAQIEQAARDNNYSLLNREARRATAAVPETGFEEPVGPSLTQEDAAMLERLGMDPARATAEDIAAARQIAAEQAAAPAATPPPGEAPAATAAFNRAPLVNEPPIPAPAATADISATAEDLRSAMGLKPGEMEAPATAAEDTAAAAIERQKNANALLSAVSANGPISLDLATNIPADTWQQIADAVNAQKKTSITADPETIQTVIKTVAAREGRPVPATPATVAPEAAAAPDTGPAPAPPETAAPAATPPPASPAEALAQEMPGYETPPPEQGPRPPTAAEKRVEALAKAIADYNIPMSDVEQLGEVPDMLARLARSLDQASPAAADIPRVIERVRELREQAGKISAAEAEARFQSEAQNVPRKQPQSAVEAERDKRSRR